MATSKQAPRPRPSVNPARVVVAATTSSSSHEYIGTVPSGVDVVGSYNRFLEDFLPEGNPQDTDNPQDHEGAGGSSNMDVQEQFEQQIKSDADYDQSHTRKQADHIKHVACMRVPLKQS